VKWPEPLPPSNQPSQVSYRRPDDLEVHRDSGAAHLRRGEAHQLARGHVILAVPVIGVPALAVTDGEPDDAERSPGSSNHCPPTDVCWADRTGAARNWSGEGRRPHRDSGVDLRSWMGSAPRGLQGCRGNPPLVDSTTDLAHGAQLAFDASLGSRTLGKTSGSRVVRLCGSRCCCSAVGL